MSPGPRTEPAKACVGCGPPPTATRSRRTSGSRWKMTTRPPLSPVASSSPVWLNSTVEMISAVGGETGRCGSLGPQYCGAQQNRPPAPQSLHPWAGPPSRSRGTNEGPMVPLSPPSWPRDRDLCTGLLRCLLPTSFLPPSPSFQKQFGGFMCCLGEWATI